MPKTTLHSWLTTKRAIIIVALILSAILLFTPHHAKAQKLIGDPEKWEISSFSSNIVLSEDGTVTLTETIVADFSKEPHHGIFRSIPAQSIQRFSLLSVNDENGNPIQYTREYNPPFLTLKIGDPDVFVNEPTTYVISYKYEKVLNHNWNSIQLFAYITGDDWAVPINNASAKITLPDSVNMEETETTCKTHYSKISTKPTCEISIEDQTIKINALKTLKTGEGLSTNLTLPKDSIPPPSTTRELMWYLSDAYKYFIHEILF